MVCEHVAENPARTRGRHSIAPLADPAFQVHAEHHLQEEHHHRVVEDGVAHRVPGDPPLHLAKARQPRRRKLHRHLRVGAVEDECDHRVPGVRHVRGHEEDVRPEEVAVCVRAPNLRGADGQRLQ